MNVLTWVMICQDTTTIFSPWQARASLNRDSNIRIWRGGSLSASEVEARNLMPMTITAMRATEMTTAIATTVSRRSPLHSVQIYPSPRTKPSAQTAQTGNGTRGESQRQIERYLKVAGRYDVRFHRREHTKPNSNSRRLHLWQERCQESQTIASVGRAEGAFLRGILCQRLLF